MMRPTCFRLLILGLVLLFGACKPIQPLVSQKSFVPYPPALGWNKTFLDSYITPPAALLQQTEKSPTLPSFLPTPCLYRIPPDAGVRCGFLLVPEDRSRPDSRIIRLHVLIFKSTSAHPQSDPLILLNGGPGSPGRPMVESILYDLIGEIWRAECDVIYLDQRGTGFSLPSLYCPEATMDETTVAGLEYEASVAADGAVPD